LPSSAWTSPAPASAPKPLALAAELQATSADFRRLWAENDVATHWVGQKSFQHPVVGPFTLETSAYSVGGADGLTMVLFTPLSPDDARAMNRLLAGGLPAVHSN
jgi:MmyB-like transcription regulator ligand binding domain